MTDINTDIMTAANEHVAGVKADQANKGVLMTPLAEVNMTQAFICGAIWMGDRILNRPAGTAGKEVNHA